MEIITLRKQNITDFAKERNLLLSKSKADWIFFVDSDEIITSELKGETLEAVKKERYNGFYVNRRNYFLGQYVGTDKIVRLGRRGLGKWVRSVHETWNIKGSIGQLENPLVHNTANNLKDYIKRMGRYSTLHAEANKKEGKKSNVFKIIFYPLAKFVVTYLKSGNTVFSIMQSFHSFLAWSKLYFLYS